MKLLSNLVYKELCDCKIYSIYRKTRKEGNFTIVSSYNFKLFYLNEDASYFLNLIKKHITLSDVISKLSTVYCMEEKELINDVLYLVRDLQWKRIIILEC